MRGAVAHGKAAAKPLFRDPVFDGAADPVVIWNRQERTWFLFYTNRNYSAGVVVSKGTDNEQSQSIWASASPLELGGSVELCRSRSASACLRTVMSWVTPIICCTCLSSAREKHTAAGPQPTIGAVRLTDAVLAFVDCFVRSVRSARVDAAPCRADHRGASTGRPVQTVFC